MGQQGKIKKPRSSPRKTRGEFFTAQALPGKSPKACCSPGILAKLSVVNYFEQTLIAKKLGISNNAFHRIVFHGKLEYKLINGKRHYDYKEVLEVIKRNFNGSNSYNKT